MKAIIIDTNALLFRIYHALPRLTDPQGRPIQSVYGLATTLFRIVQDFKPDYIFSCWDRPEPTFRHQAYREYKAQRPPVADDFKIQIPLAKKVMQAFRIPIVEVTGYEADDLIATLKKLLSDKVIEIIILTGDLDTLQLVDQKTKVYTMKKGIREMQFYDVLTVQERFGILPEQIVDFKALVGDPSDNIKGIYGIGKKTASRLLQKYHNLEDIIAAAEKGILEPKFRDKILEEKERLIFQKNLLTLKKDVPIKIDIKRYPEPDYNSLFFLFQNFGFRSLAKRIEPFVQEKHSLFFSKKSIFLKQSNELPTLKQDDKVFAFLDQNQSKLYLIVNQKVYSLPKEKIKEIFLLDNKKYFWDVKAFWKEVCKLDWYFDQKIDLNNIFDLKVMFWLTEPTLGRYSFKEAITFFLPRIPLTLSLEDYFAYLEEFREKVEAKMENFSLWQVYQEIERPLTPVLARMELSGIKIDSEKVRGIKQECLKEVQKLKQEIQTLAGMPFNPLSTKELRYILFEKLKLPTKGFSKTSKGKISTQESELLKIINLHPIIAKILDYRKLIKVASTYTDSLLVSYNPKSGRVHPTYNQTGTSTGRLSSDNPNVQNIPLTGKLASLVRASFISEDGKIFLGADYSQLELRLAAHLSEDENLLTAFREDFDVHSQTAKLVFGEETLETRRKAKIINFGIIYGMHVKGLAERLNIPTSEAQKIIQRYFKFYPGLQKLKEELIEKAKTYGYAETLFGRKLLLPEIHSRSYQERTLAERIAINMPIQGLGADILKKAMVAIDRDFYQNAFGRSANIILSIHDELVCEINEEFVDAVDKIIKDKLEKVISLKVPLKVKIKEGRNLQEIKE